MDRAALLAQQGGISGLLHERMPEGVAGGRRLTMRNNDFSSCKLGEHLLQTFGRQPRYGLYELE